MLFNNYYLCQHIKLYLKLIIQMYMHVIVVIVVIPTNSKQLVLLFATNILQ